ncbi:unnamed protein product, partial [Owenia fusiformis]
RIKMSAPMSFLAVRGSEGVYLKDGPPSYENKEDFVGDQTKVCKAFTFSRDGTLFAWTNGRSVQVISLPGVQLVQDIEKPRTTGVEISPHKNLIALWESYKGEGEPNLSLYDLKSGTLVKSFIQKKQQGWCPQWSADEEICSRLVNNELQFYEKNNFSTIANKLHLQKVQEFALSRGPPPYHIAVYVLGSKGQPSFVRIYKYPALGGLNSALANKSFFQADKVQMLWNSNATGVLVLTTNETADTSYYGDQKLHFVGSNGESCMVSFAKNGPIYHIEWNPKDPTQFCVLYGFMPAKATLFNLKCEPIFDFGTGPRNACYYNPQGTILCLAGFGNLRGLMEFWDVKQKKLISNPTAADTTQLYWCPDGEHITTATTSPRLRVGNGYKTWHYTGVLLHETNTPAGLELWDVRWQPVPEGTFPPKPLSYKPVQSTVAPPPSNVKAGVYRPPGAKGVPSTFKLHDIEPPSNAKPASAELSKAALKNKKKREAKARAKEEHPEEFSPAPTPVPQAAPSSGDPETDKKVRNLRKKLQAIEKLKQQQKEGKTLEKNQLDKLKTESALLEEMKALQIR